MRFFLTDLHHNLHARSCIHVLRVFNLLFEFFNFYLFCLLFGSHLGYSYTSRAGASAYYIDRVLAIFTAQDRIHAEREWYLSAARTIL